MDSARTFATMARVACMAALVCAMTVAGIAPAPAATSTGFSLELTGDRPFGTYGTLVIDGPDSSSEHVVIPMHGLRISRDAHPGDYTATFLPLSPLVTTEDVTFTVREGEVARAELRPLTIFARGTLVDPAGSPLAGVAVQAVREGKVESTVRTGPEGVFRLDYLLPGTYHLDFPRTYEPSGASFEVVAHEMVDLGQVEARPGRTVTTRLVDDLGVPVADESATLTASDGSWLRRATSTTAGQLTFTGVPIGQATLDFADSSRQALSRTVSVLSPTTRIPDIVLPLLSVRLAGSVDLPGRLRGDEKPPQVLATLYAESSGRPVGPAIDVERASWRRGTDGWQWATFDLDAPPSQRYVVQYSEVRPDGNRVLQHQVVTVGRTSLLLDAVTPSFGAPITGQVRDSSLGLWPKSGVVYSDVPCTGPLPVHRGGPMVMSDAKGRFRVPTIPGHCYALTLGNLRLHTTYVPGLERVRPGRTDVMVHPRLSNYVSRVTTPDAHTIRVTVRTWPAPAGIRTRIVDGGTVKVWEHGRVIGTATVNRQSAVVHLKRPLRAGTHSLRIDYTGTRLFLPSTTPDVIVRR